MIFPKLPPIVKSFFFLAVFLLTSVIFLGPTQASHIPAPSGFVSDFAQVLSQEQHIALETSLLEYEEKTSNEIAVAFIKSLEGENIDDFTVKVFEEWKIGKKGNDNGILFLAAIEDRKMRIEVGYGLEPYLTDGEAGEIIRDIIAPEFREGNYYNGITAGVKAIQENLSGTTSSEKERHSSSGFSGRDYIEPLVWFFLGTFLFVASVLLYEWWKKGRKGIVLTKGLLVGGGFLVLLLLLVAIFYDLIVLLVVGAVLYEVWKSKKAFAKVLSAAFAGLIVILAAGLLIFTNERGFSLGPLPPIPIVGVTLMSFGMVVALIIVPIVGLIYVFSFLGRSKSIWLGAIAGVFIGWVIGLFLGAATGKALLKIAPVFLFGLSGLLLDWWLSKNYTRLKKLGKKTGWWNSKGGFSAGGGKGSGSFGGGSSGGGGASGGW